MRFTNSHQSRFRRNQIYDEYNTDKKIRKGKIPVLRILVISLLVIVACLVACLLMMRTVGKKNLMTPVAGADATGIEIESTETAAGDQALADNQILYKGQVYAQNEDIITILMMGIDKESVQTIGGESWTAEGANAGGQADALFLVVIDPHTENVRIVSINRNSMTDVDVWDENGDYVGVMTKQIALQHAYGAGDEASCEHQVKAVSRMFHGIPINGYAAIEMDAIPEINDAVGGVTVDVLEDVVRPEDDVYLYEGNTETLTGMEAYYYLRHRDTKVFGSSDARLLRQKQYVGAFVKKLRKKSTTDINVALNLFKALQKYMVTDLDQSTFTYMVTEFASYHFEMDQMRSVEGETVRGEKFEEFYVDDDALQDLIVELYYEPIND